MAESERSEVGYQGISVFEIFSDLILENDDLEPRKILEATIPSLRGLKYVPVYKYLAGVGIRSREEYARSGLKLDRYIFVSPAAYSTSAYAKPFLKSEKDKTAVEIIATNPPEKAAMFLTFLPKEKFDLLAVRQFLKENIENLKGSNYATFFRKLACLYDCYAYGGW